MNTIQSRVKLYSLVETYLRGAAKDVKPITASQLLSIPDVHRAAGGQIKEVLNVLRTYWTKDVLINFSENHSFAASAYTWKNDEPTPQIRVQSRRTRVEIERDQAAAKRQHTDIVLGKEVTKENPLYKAMGPEHVPNKPVGQEAGYQAKPAEHNRPPRTADLMDIGMRLVADGYKVTFDRVNNKLTLIITEH